MIINPLFLCGTVIGEKIYFSEKDFGGIFSYNLKSKTTQTEKVIFEKKRIYRSCVNKDGKVYFITQDGNFIDIYDVHDNTIKGVMIGRDKNANISSINIYGNKILLSPYNRDCSPYWFDIDSGKLYMDDKLFGWIKNAPGENRRIFSKGCIRNDSVYFGIFRTNKVLRYFLDSAEMEIIDTNVKDIYTVQVTDTGIWVLGVDGCVEYLKDTGESEIYDIEFKPENDKQWAFNTLFEKNGEAYILPAYAQNIVKIKKGTIETINYPDDVNKIGKNAFFGFDRYADNFYLFPWGFDKMMVYNTNDECLKTIQMTVEINDKDSIDLYMGKNDLILNEKESRIGLDAFLNFI